MGVAHPVDVGHALGLGLDPVHGGHGAQGEVASAGLQGTREGRTGLYGCQLEAGDLSPQLGSVSGARRWESALNCPVLVCC